MTFFKKIKNKKFQFALPAWEFGCGHGRQMRGEIYLFCHRGSLVVLGAPESFILVSNDEI